MSTRNIIIIRLDLIDFMEVAKDDCNFKVNKWSGVAVWSFTVSGIEICSICKENLTSICNYCRVEATSDCKVCWGNCRHAYHKHCIETYMSRRGTNKCPIDTNIWVPTREERIDSLGGNLEASK